ncbi:MAG: 2Fe-2S iron-sulfur cluster-binding protein [Acidiferrobacterales bacterium]|nr:2Fe-2S iron-sulfur cluster-binding protein [Acidiferrobacterales bacterium]
MFNVHIRQSEQTIQVEVGSTILETALAAGIEYPHGCRAGNCGGCKSRIHSGEVELSPYSEFALSQEEYDSGLILACRAVPWSDCEVSWHDQDDHAAHAVRRLACEVSGLERLTSDIASVKVRLALGESFSHSSGQFVYVTFEGYPRREYSIASFESDEMEFYIRRIEGGAVSSFVWDYLQVGETVQIEGPYGNMYYRIDHAGPVLAIAGGSGLSAIQSVACDAVTANPSRAVYLYHGVRDESDIFRAELFFELAREYESFSYIPVLSNPSAPSQVRTGLLSEVLAQDFRSDEEFMAYMAGPPPMVRTCTEALCNIGVMRSNIHADPFLTAADRAW